MKFGDYTLDILMEKIPPRPDESTAQYLCRAEMEFNERPEILHDVVQSIKAEMNKLEFKEGDTLVAVGFHSLMGKCCIVGKVTESSVELTWDKESYPRRYSRKFVQGAVSDQRFVKA